MKSNLIWVTKILSFLILFSCCKVFEAKTYTINEAIESEKNIKLKVNNTGPYVFSQLIIIDDQLYGLIPKKNKNKKWLDSNIVDDNYEGKYKLFELEENSIRDLQKPLSLTGTIVVSALLIGLIILSTGAYAL